MRLIVFTYSVIYFYFAPFAVFFLVVWVGIQEFDTQSEKAVIKEIISSGFLNHLANITTSEAMSDTSSTDFNNNP